MEMGMHFISNRREVTALELSQLESMSEDVVTALLEYILLIRELIVTDLQ